MSRTEVGARLADDGRTTTIRVACIAEVRAQHVDSPVVANEWDIYRDDEAGADRAFHNAVGELAVVH